MLSLCFSLKLKQWSNLKNSHHYYCATRSSEAPEETYLRVQGVCSRSCQHVTLWVWQLAWNAHCATGLVCLGFLGATCGPVSSHVHVTSPNQVERWEEKKKPNVKTKNLAESFSPWIFDETVTAASHDWSSPQPISNANLKGHVPVSLVPLIFYFFYFFFTCAQARLVCRTLFPHIFHKYGVHRLHSAFLIAWMTKDKEGGVQRLRIRPAILGKKKSSHITVIQVKPS